MIDAVAGNKALADACKSACDNPTSILHPTEIGTIRNTILPAPSQAPAKAPPLPTIIRGGDVPAIISSAEKYPGQ